MKLRHLLSFGGLTAAMSLAFAGGCAGTAPSASAVRYPELNRVMRQLENGEAVTIAYLGGSITWGATSTDPLKTSWRALTTAWMERQYPRAHVKAVDAAIGGKGSELAVFRVDRDVLPSRPDLTFVEFAVNDAGNADGSESMEGIIRKLRRCRPDMAIVMVVIGSGAKNYGTPRETEYVRLADYYGLPVINICSQIKAKIAAGLKTADFLTDGCHPNDYGYRMYADIVEQELPRLAEAAGTPVSAPAAPLTRNRFESARMIELASAIKSKEWKSAVPDVTGIWFDHQPSRWLSSVVIPTTPDAAAAMKLECSGLGLYFETIPQGGKATIKVDGKKFLTVDTAFKLHYPGLGYKFKFLPQTGTRDVTLAADHTVMLKIGYLLVTGP